jgi:hypothetical protein
MTNEDATQALARSVENLRRLFLWVFVIVIAAGLAYYIVHSANAAGDTGRKQGNCIASHIANGDTSEQATAACGGP